MVSRLLTIVSCSVLILFSGAAAAQESTTTLLTTIKAKPGGNGGIEQVMAALVAAAEQSGSEDMWLTSQSVTGAPVYRVAMQMDSMSRLGEPPIPALLAEVYGEEEALRMGELFSANVESIDSVFYTSQPQVSSPWDSDDAPAGFVLYEMAINEGMGQQYMETAVLTREAAMAVQPDLRYLILTPGIGAGNVVLVVAFIADWAELDTPAGGPGVMVRQHFGATAGAAISEAAASTVGDMQLTLYRTRPDLAYNPGN